MKEVIQVWCEWDIGLSGIVFLEYESAKQSAIAALKECDIEETFDELMLDGLLWFEYFKVKE